MSHPNQFADARQALAFVLGGNATFTLRSKATDARFTYRVRQKDDGKVFFASLLNGADNETSYAYFGFFRNGTFRHGGAKARAGLDAPSVKAFVWTMARLAEGRIPDNLEIWHEGRCGRCGRKLTVPSSIASGLGPECASRDPFFASEVA